ncbi:MAG: PIG-L deacetylase family protein [Acidimicrobiales bacterium]
MTSTLRTRVSWFGQRTVALGWAFLASDITQDVARRPAVVFAPHADDETLGCGATILLKRANTMPVTVVVATDGSHFPHGVAPEVNRRVRHLELLEACGRLGVEASNVIHLAHPEARLEERSTQLADDVARILGDHDLASCDVFSTNPWDPHLDHRTLGRVVRTVALYSGVRLYEYPIWQWGRLRGWAPTAGKVFSAGHPVKVRAANHRDAKEHSLRAYLSQLQPELGGYTSNGLAKPFVAQFLRDSEVFFRVRPQPPAVASPLT